MKKAILFLAITTVTNLITSQSRYDVVITEIMADPSPSVGLPNYEWVELKNTSPSPINLQGWHIGDAVVTSGPMPSFILQPDSFVIVCGSSAINALSQFGTAVNVTSFPSLDNNGELVFLIDANGNIIHCVKYSSDWYPNALKKEGGWSLEMIDTKNPCAGYSNWTASTNTAGGSPGRTNSVDAINADQLSPALRRTFSFDSLNIIAVFDEPVDSLSASFISNFVIDGGLSISSATAVAPLFEEVRLTLNVPMEVNKKYNLTAVNITDCKGNTINTQNKALAGLPSAPSALDIIINEILFNPRSNGHDYIEFYNRSDRIVDLSKLYIANRDATGSISSPVQLNTSPFYLFPGEYSVVTEDIASLQLNYLVKYPEVIISPGNLPSYPDKEGTVVLLGFQGEIIDEVRYSEDWHFKLIDNSEGISLERIDPEAPSQGKSNWHSAASTAGFGTPGYVNSQFSATAAINAAIGVFPKIFSPDNDGRDDLASIQYQLDEPGYIANLTIFDLEGRPVKYLVRNATLGLSGYWNWDGLGEYSNKLLVGVYIVFTEVFNLRGKKRQFKNIIVLARPLN